MKFKIEEKILEDFNSPVIGVIVGYGIDNSGENPEITGLLRQIEKKIRHELGGVDVATHPHIVPWRQAYQQFGSKPRDFRCSIEALLRVVLRGSEIRKINKLVDLYNYASLKYILPVGAEDLDKMEGDLILGYAKGDEEYTPLDEEENDPPQKGEVIYRDNRGVICRRWNWREGDRTKITEETKNAIVVIESLSPIPVDLMKKALNELAKLIKKYCGGEVKILILDKNQPASDLTFGE